MEVLIMGLVIGFSVTGIVFSIVTILNTRNKVNQKK